MYKLHKHCRACGLGKVTTPNGIKVEKPDEKLISVFDLGLQPLANDFVKPGGEHAGFAPLEVLYCPRCSLAQLSVVVDPFVLYHHYNYVTSTSETMHQHFERLYQDLMQEQDGKLGHVLEIGSNDGAFLKFLKGNQNVYSKGVLSVTGVDPAENLASAANTDGIHTICGKWGSRLATYLPFHQNTIIARHVFCHVDDWQDFIAGLEVASDKNTLVAIEVPYVRDLLEFHAFDTIYHEHLSYLSLKSVNRLLENTKFKLYGYIKYDIHAGAILLLLRRREYEQTEKVLSHVADDEITEQDWRKFAYNSHNVMNELKREVLGFQTNKKRVCGFGASAKSTVWINACGFTKRQIQFICDCTPQKQYCLSPGTDIPIVDEGALLREMPDYCIIFAWNFCSEILEKNKLYREKGGKFIVPIPTLRII